MYGPGQLPVSSRQFAIRRYVGEKGRKRVSTAMVPYFSYGRSCSRCVPRQMPHTWRTYVCARRVSKYAKLCYCNKRKMWKTATVPAFLELRCSKCTSATCFAIWKTARVRNVARLIFKSLFAIKNEYSNESFSEMSSKMKNLKLRRHDLYI